MKATRDMRLAAFLAVRKKISGLPMSLSDDEIHQISDAAVEAALAEEEEERKSANDT